MDLILPFVLLTALMLSLEGFAATWFLLAAEAGNSTAREECAFVEKQVLTPREIKQARAKAQRCKKSAFKHCN